MASGMTSGGKRPAPVIAGSGTSLQYDQIIESQLLKTRRRVKWVDLATVAMGLAGGVLLFVLLLVLIDHWVFDLGRGGRLAALVVLLAGVGFYTAAVLVPLFRRGINPVYAARAIEQSDPSLKNSLINFLMFRRDASTTSRLVHQALRQRAATDLQQINVDLAVDQSRVIRLGYVVVVLMVLLVGYTIFSPKDLFQTLRRFSAPWADIARPTRVRILDVEPGDTQRVFGERVAVTARIQGVRSDDVVRLVYSTEDAQALDREIRMTPSESGSSYACELPADPAGLQQNVTYRIEAGDGRTRDFQVEVSATPSILVERVEYDYPAYMRRERRVVSREGEVSGLEGTRVTIHAVTNHPIQTATIEFNPGVGAAAIAGMASRTQPMEVVERGGREARYSFTLAWDYDRDTPVYTSYRLAFVTTGERRSEDSIVHGIQVSRDLPPEIAILTPRRDEITLPLSATQRIEVRAIDPDFGLSRVVLRAKVGGRSLLDEPLMSDEAGLQGQVVLDYDFSPARLGLSVGDRVAVSAYAEDNRSLPLEKHGGPNSDFTRDYVITIAPPDATASSGESSSPDQQSGDTQDQGDQGDQGAPPKPADGSQGASGDQQRDPNQSSSDGSSQTEPQQGSSAQQKPDKQGEQAQGADQQSAGGQAAGEAGQTAPEQQAGAEGAPSGQQQEGASQETGQTGQSGAMEDGSGSSDAGQSGSGAGGGGDQGSEQSGGSDASGTASGSSPSSAQGDSSDDGGAPSTAAQPSGDGQGGDTRQEPLHDGDVFERLRDRFESQRDSSPSSSSAQSGEGAQDASSASSDPQTGSRRDRSSADGSASQSPAQPPGQTGEATSDPTAGEGDRKPPPGSDGAGDGANGGAQSTPPGDSATGAKPQPSPAAGADGQAQPDRSEGAGGDDQGAERAQEMSDGQRSPGEAAQQADSSGSAAGADRSATQDPGGTATTDDPSQRPAGDSQGAGEQPAGGREPSGGDDAQGGQPLGAGERQPQQTAGQGDSQGEESAGGPDGQASPSGDSQMPTGKEPSPGQQEGPTGEQPAGQAGQSTAEPGSPDGPRPPESPPRGEPGSGTAPGRPQGDGLPSDADSTPVDRFNELAEADAVNLDYARKATDLVLERLKDQQNDPDPELLKSMGWTAEELQQFIARWEALKRAAREDPLRGQAELDDALRSLGLRAADPRRRSVGAETQQTPGLQDRGRSRPPAQFLEQFNAYKQGAARGQATGGDRNDR